MKHSGRLIASTLLLAFTAGSTLAQSYPVKPVRVIVPFPPGGGVDSTARAIAQKFSDAWRQQVIVDNRPGGGANIGASAVAKAAPDGYTLLVASTALAIAPSLYRKLPFDPVKDLLPVSQILATSHVLAVHPSMPVTLKELVALAKSRPGKLNYANTGVGTGTHLLGEIMRFATDINIVMVPYKGDAQAVPAMLAGEVDMGFSPPTNVIQLVRAGKLRALAMSGTSRSPAFPEVPTTAEAGFPEVTNVGWVSIFAPAGTPRDIVNKISAETIRALRMPDIIEQLPRFGGDAAETTPEEFAAKYRADVARYARIIEKANVPPMD